MERIICILAVLLISVPSMAAEVAMKDKAGKVALRTDEVPVSTDAGTSGMEAIADLFGLIEVADISDASVTATEFAELETIGDTTISAGQWVFVGAQDQATYTTSTPQFVGIELGHASDSSILRSGAGDATIEGNQIYRAGGTDVPDGDVADDITITNISQVSDVTASASEINTPLDGATVTLTEFEELATVGATTISAGQWVFVGSQDQATYTTSEVDFDSVTADIYYSCNAAEPNDYVFGMTVCADGATWNPSGQSWTGFETAEQKHWTAQVQPADADCSAENDPHTCCTGSGTGSCTETWVVKWDILGNWYLKEMPMPGYAHYATADHPYDDTTTPHVLTTSEVKGGLIGNGGATQDRVYTTPAAASGFSFMVMVSAAYQMDLEPATGENFILNGLAMAANEHIQNTADTKGDVMFCWSYETGDGTFEYFCNSDNANWVEATPP